MAFHVGQKVVCIKRGKWNRAHLHEIFPRYGEIYTIRAMRHEHGETGFFLSEIINREDQYLEGFSEVAFLSKRFRPIRTTNITVFKNMLAPSPKRAKRKSVLAVSP